jgi:hypothetical protein
MMVRMWLGLQGLLGAQVPEDPPEYLEGQDCLELVAKQVSQVVQAEKGLQAAMEYQECLVTKVHLEHQEILDMPGLLGRKGLQANQDRMD